MNGSTQSSAMTRRLAAQLRQMFKQFRDDYGKRSDTELDYRTSVLADAVYALELRIAALDRSYDGFRA